jgi:hypothetical protein
MSANPAGDEIRDETPPTEPLVTAQSPTAPPIPPNPLTRFLPLVVPAVVVVLAICAVVYGLIPAYYAAPTASNNLEKIRQSGVSSYSHTYRVTPPPHYPFNNPSGRLTAPIP